MTASRQERALLDLVGAADPDRRLVEAVRLYFAYFLTIDELQRAHARFADDFRRPGAGEAYRAELPWFSRFSPQEVATFEELVSRPRPFVWPLEVLRREFALALEAVRTPWVTVESADYSNGRKLGEGPLFELDWCEERGMVAVDGMLVGRTVQPVVIEDRVSEPVMVAMGGASHDDFAATFDVVPALGGGCAFKALYGPAQLNINWADDVGVDNVDSAMLCVGRLVEDPATREVSVREFPRFDYFAVRRRLSNGVEVPFVQ